jgi:hypothetical protein
MAHDSALRLGAKPGLELQEHLIPFASLGAAALKTGYSLFYYSVEPSVEGGVEAGPGAGRTGSGRQVRRVSYLARRF